MSEVFWQAKIWGLLHDPAIKALHDNSGHDSNSFWQQLEVMQPWRDKGWNPEDANAKLLQHIHLADYITSASDRGAIGSVSRSVNYAPSHNRDKGLEISHLLSGSKLHFKIPQHWQVISDRKTFLQQQEKKLLEIIPNEAKTDIKRLFWWLWRCLPQATCDLFGDDSLLLMPAETRLPDSSIWSHASLTAALAGALAGYDLIITDLESEWSSDKTLSHPYLATFSFSPVQELIKASRKMRDFWAGSWILHYLSATVCWKLARQYGADSLLYPSLYQQPLIDHWLLQQYPEFNQWVKQPSERSLLTAGFPNVLVLVLPKDKVSAAMQTAKQTLLETWRDLGKKVFQQLNNQQKKHQWMSNLHDNSSTWDGWLDAQWQTYWSAIPIGKEGESIKNAAIPAEREAELQLWLDTQNNAYGLTQKNELFHPHELDFLRAAYQQPLEKRGRNFSVNVGSWWPHIFDQTRYALSAVKNARTWLVPTAFGPRSTISGIGSVVHPGADWVTEGDTKKYWQRQVGLFDGTEQLNATETLKRGLEKVLPQLLKGTASQPTEEEIADIIAASYPDLTAGVAGYLNSYANADVNHRRYFHLVCQAITEKIDWAEKVIKRMRSKWGIPLIDDSSHPKKYHPRLLNAGWLVEDAETDELEKIQQALNQETDPIIIEQLNQDIGNLKANYRQDIQKLLDDYYPSNNPADWYVLAAGDGDGMSEWLKGKKLDNYSRYLPSELHSQIAAMATAQDENTQTVAKYFQAFIELKKRMGPSTHSALSRALLDFSNQLVPYLTERRYAGRLIYGGGDDVLAYTNLWEWDNWLWNIRQCFRGDEDPDPSKQFDNEGDYWRWQAGEPPKDSSGNPLLSTRPLFTMGHSATISFGIVIANHSVPLAIALENLWKAEEEAKAHKYWSGCSWKKKKDCYTQKDAVQVRVLYSNGNILKATAKFDVFHLWQQLLTLHSQASSAIFEQAATLWSQHPAPTLPAIKPWTIAFCDRRDLFKSDDTAKTKFQQQLREFLDALWRTTPEEELEREIQSWLKLAAFVLRNRDIKIKPERLS